MSTRDSYSSFAQALRTTEQVREPGSKATPDYAAGKRIRAGRTKNVLVPVGLFGRLLRALDDETINEVCGVLGLELTTACMDVAGWEDLQAGAA